MNLQLMSGKKSDKTFTSLLDEVRLGSVSEASLKLLEDSHSVHSKG